jgi:fermentation-respiration switch protein FrsA (DUF1100 family)
VILLHGYGANRMEMLKRASILVESGYGVLLYDQRASGESQGNVRSAGWADVKDVPAALAFLLEREEVDPDRIGILGFSVGGQIAVQAAAEMDELRAVVAEEPGFAALEDLSPLRSPYERWIALNYWFGFKGLEWRTGIRAPSGVAEGIADIAPRPLLLVAAGSPEKSEHRLIRYFYERAGEPKTLWEVPEASHGGVPVVRPDEYEERIVTFFDGALLAEPQ